MSTVAERVTLSEFDRLFAEEKPYYEYWHGEPVQKSAPTWIHSALQQIAIELLKKLGYLAGAEIRLKIDLDLQLFPDVIGTKAKPGIPYPTRAVEIAVEILSPGDPLERVKQKCEAYAKWGFREIYVIDSERRLSLEWRNGLIATDRLTGDIPASEIWDRLDRDLG